MFVVVEASWEVVALTPVDSKQHRYSHENSTANNSYLLLHQTVHYGSYSLKAAHLPLFIAISLIRKDLNCKLICARL